MVIASIRPFAVHRPFFVISPICADFILSWYFEACQAPTMMDLSEFGVDKGSVK